MGCARFVFPDFGDFAEKSDALTREFVEFFRAAMTVVSGAGRAEKGAWAVLRFCHGVDEVSRGVASAGDDALAFCTGPEADDGFAGEMDDGVESGQIWF